MSTFHRNVFTLYLMVIFLVAVFNYMTYPQLLWRPRSYSVAPATPDRSPLALNLGLRFPPPHETSTVIAKKCQKITRGLITAVENTS